MVCMRTPEGQDLRGIPTTARRTVSTGSVADTTGTADENSVASREDMPRIGEETPTTAFTASGAATTGFRANPTIICGHRKTGGRSIAAATDPAGTAVRKKASGAGRAHPTPVRCNPIVLRLQVFSAANSGDRLPELLRAATLRAQPENHRTRVASICLVAGTLPRPLAAAGRTASTSVAAGIRRRAFTAAGEISAAATRTAEEVTPAVTAEAGITAEADCPSQKHHRNPDTNATDSLRR